jgi:stage V sporulation protein R
MLATDTYMTELQRRMEQVYAIAAGYGLDPFPIHWEIVPAEILYEFGAYGLPGRFAHWTHGRAYHRQKIMYDYGLSKIYELVINANPAYAFLLDGNSVLQNTLIAAHVIAHVDFFKHNQYFAPTNRGMVEGASASADRIRQYEFRHGRRRVEEFIDAVLSVEELIDPHQRLRRRPASPERPARPGAGPYDDLLGPASPAGRGASADAPTKIPPEPEKDVLGFLMEQAPDLEDWQRDVIEVVRNEMLYFVPQMQTKIMNEGWASYWHQRIVRELELSDREYVEFARMNAGVLAPSKRDMNPYHVGLKIFEDIERRWDDPTEEERRTLGRQPGQGRAKMFEVRELESDVAFLRNHLTPGLVEELDLYIYKVEEDGKLTVVEKDWEKIRDMIVGSMTNFGVPYIQVEDGDHRKARELYLRHVFEGREIDVRYAERVLRYLHRIWGRPVHIETVLDQQPCVLSFDGPENRRQGGAAAEPAGRRRS